MVSVKRAAWDWPAVLPCSSCWRCVAPDVTCGSLACEAANWHVCMHAGPWPVKPQHLQELAAKEQQDGADKASAADAQAEEQRQQQAAGRQSAGGGPAVVEQVLQLNNELFMTPEALFRQVNVDMVYSASMVSFGVKWSETATANYPVVWCLHIIVLSCADLLGRQCRANQRRDLLSCCCCCRPSDIGLNQAGLPECVVQAVAACPAGLAPLLYAQV